MHSPSCGFENPDGLKFCNECGTTLRVPCAQCGFANQPLAKFCGECEAVLASRARASTVPSLVPRLYAPVCPEYLNWKSVDGIRTMNGKQPNDSNANLPGCGCDGFLGPTGFTPTAEVSQEYSETLNSAASDV